MSTRRGPGEVSLPFPAIFPARARRATSGTLVPPDVLLLGALLIANCAWAVIWPSLLTTTLATLLWLAAIARLFVFDARIVVLLAPFLVIQFSALISLNAIEAGGYMREMDTTGAASSASASYVLCSLWFLLCGTWTYLRRRDRAMPQPQQLTARHRLLEWGAVAIAAPIVAYLIVGGLRNGFPLLTGTDRFQYRMMSADILTLNFLNLKFVVAALLGCGAAFATSRVSRACHHLAFSGYLLVSFLFGDKFFIIISATCFYAMAFSIRGREGVRGVMRRYAPLGVVAMASVISVTLFIYSDYGMLPLDTTLTRLAERIAGQGQIWFLAVRDSSRFAGFDTHIVLENLRSLFANPSAIYVFDHRLGPFHFVERYSPPDLYFSFLHNGGAVTPTMIFEGYGLVAFGYAGLAVLILLMGLVAGTVLEWLARAMSGGNPVDVLLPAFVATQVLAVMAQGTLYSLLGLSAFKAYAAFFVLQQVVRELVKPPAPRRQAS